MAKKKIFISYSRADTEYVSSLVNNLRRQNYDVWFDKEIRSGTDWDNTIEEEIKNADTMILVLSKTSVASENVKDEMSYAMSLSKGINPIMIEECDVPMRLARKQHIDFTNSFDDGFSRLLKDLSLQLNVENDGPIKTVDSPSKRDANSLPKKKSNKTLIYIVAGIAALVAFFVAMNGGVFGDSNSENTESSESTNTTVNENAKTSNDAAWAAAQRENTLYEYAGYIYNNGTEDGHFQDANDAISELLEEKGIIIYSYNGEVENLKKYLYINPENQQVFMNSNDTALPRSGDILETTAQIDVFNYETGAYEGKFIPAGSKVQIERVTAATDDGMINLYVRYSNKQ